MYVLGHEKVTESFKQIVAGGKAAHAYLLTGREGIGKRLPAIKLACLLNCPDPLSDPDSECPICVKIQTGKHPDIIMIEPEKNAIRIDRIRNLQAFFRYAPVEGKSRVAIINDAHLMNTAAQNALLKTLEEPPPGRTVILVSAKPNLLLSTVRSRCRRVRLAPLSSEQVAILLEQKGVPKDKAAALAAISGGSIGNALELTKGNFAQIRTAMMDFLSNPMKGGLSGVLELSADISSERHRAFGALDAAKTIVRDLTAMNLGSQNIINRDLIDILETPAQNLSIDQLVSIYNELSDASVLLEAETNINKNLITDVMLLKIARIINGPNFGIQSRSVAG
jgi:DNA polymerase III subunit delta'